MTHHGAGLLKITQDTALVEALSKDYTIADLSGQDRAMLDYAAKLTREPWKMCEADVELLREKGFSDEAVLDICQITAYYAYVNRIADGLGVEMEEFWET